MKLLHVSDIHFGTRFLNKDPKLRELLIEESYKTFNRLVEYLLKNDVKALLIPGDLFDGEYRSLRAEKYLIKTFNQLKNYGVRVFYSLGNHDSNTTFKNGFLRELPNNVILFNEEKPSSYLLEDQVYIHSCGHQSKNEDRNLVRNFPKAIEGYYNIGLLHCSIVSSVKKGDVYLPTKVEDLKSKNYDYWALGHIHKRSKITGNIYYSGSLYGLNSKETGHKGGLLITLEDNAFSVNFIDLSTINYESIRVDFQETSIKNEYELLEVIKEKLKPWDKKIMLKLVLTGGTKLYTFLTEEIHREELKNEIKRESQVIDVVMDTGGIERTINYKDYIKADNVLGYIEKNINDEAIRMEMLEKYKVDPTEEDFIKELMYMMVGAKNED
jgi:DNA repair exonuclease SbcCD nuclease subunit